jgi:hypothetical protein
MHQLRDGHCLLELLLAGAGRGGIISFGIDKVRQFSQASTDGGKTWKVEYDFIYTRKK